MIGRELICIDDKNLPPQIENKPVEGSIYTLRELKRNPDGSWGFLLNEIVNKIVKQPCADIGLWVWMEPNFSRRRFTTLLGKELTVEEIESFLREKVKQTQKDLQESI